MQVSDLPSIEEIITLRKSLGITQPKLANAIGEARGTIARMETGKYIPKYHIIQKIFEYLYSKKSPTAKPLYKLCSRKIISITPNQTLDMAIKLIIKNKFDCIPVIERKVLKGNITIQKLATRKTNIKDSKIKISEFMDEAPPTVPYNTPVTNVESFLKTSDDCVILTKRGEFYGIVTPWDLLNK